LLILEHVFLFPTLSPERTLLLGGNEVSGKQTQVLALA